jgi:hypothetical protein
LQAVSARRAGVQTVVEESSVDRFGREGDPLVFRVSGLSADSAFVLTLWRRRLSTIPLSFTGGFSAEDARRSGKPCFLGFP